MATSHTAGLPVAITVDLHDGDLPRDITFAAEWLADNGVAATFFIHSTLLESPRYAPRLRELPALGHETASHTHRHDAAETDALIAGGPAALRFLEQSFELHAEFFGEPPGSFRAPGWCALGPAALDELERLGYTVDSSATPQRLSVLGSTPFRGAWALSPRSPYHLRPGLLEIPTSTAMVPAGSPAFLILRQRMSCAFVRLLMLEARLTRNRVVVLQFHPDDFNPGSGQGRACAGRLRLEDFVLHRQGGFGFKHHLKDTDRERIGATTQSLVRLVASGRCLTLRDLAGRLARAGGTAIPAASFGDRDPIGRAPRVS